MTRNQEKFLTLMEHYGEATEYAKVAAESSGTALEKFNNSYLGSIEASQDAFKAQYEQLSNNILNGGLIKFTYDSGTGILGFFNSILKTFKAFPTLAATAMGVVSGFANKNIANLVNKADSKSGKGIQWSLFGLLDGNRASKDASVFNRIINDMDKTKSASISLKKEMDSLCSTNQKWAKELLESNKSNKQMKTEIINTSKSLDKMSISSVKAAVGAKALNVAMNVGMMLVVSGVIQLIVLGLDKLIVTQKEAVETASKMQGEYKSLDDEVKSLNSELSTTADRITELQSKGNLSLTEQAELNRLKESNSELAVQLELKEKLRELAAEEANKATIDAISSKSSKVYSGTKYGRESNVFEKNKGLEGVQKQIDKAKELQDKTSQLKADLAKLDPTSQEYARKSSQINSYDKDLKLLNKDLMDNMNFLMNQRNELVGNSEEVVATREEIDKLSSSYLLLSNGDRTTVFDSILNKDKFKEVREEITVLNEEISKENFESKYPELVNDLKEVGFTTEEAIDHINSKFNELNENLDNFADKFSTLKDLTSSAVDSSSLMDSVNKSVDESGIISLDILNKIGEKYTDLQSVIEQYKLGVISTTDVYDLISQRYDQDVDDHEKALTRKLLNEDWFVQGILNNDENVIEFLKNSYSGDVDEFIEYVKTKAELDKTLCEVMGEDWVTLLKGKGLAEDEMLKQSIARLEMQKEMAVTTTKIALKAMGLNEFVANDMISRAINPFQGKIDKLKESLTNLDSIEFGSFDISGVDRLTSSLDSASSASDKLNNSLREEGNARIKVLDKEIQRIRDRQKASDEYYDKKIKRIQDEKKELQDEWKEQDALLQIEKDRKALEDAKNQKIVNLYKKGEGFVHYVDQEAVDKAQETLDKSQQDLDRQQELQAIDDKISRLERLKKKSHESYNSQIEDLEEIKEKYQEAMSHIGETLDEHKAHIEITAAFERETLNQQAKSWEDYADRVVAAMRRIAKAEKSKSSSKSPKSKSSKGGRAIGTSGIESSGVYNVHEEGSELIVRQPARGNYTFLEYGDGVLPHFETKNLMEIGALGVNGMLDRMSKMFSPVTRTNQASPSIQITIPSIHLHEVQNVETLGSAIVNQLPNTVIQKLFRK